MCKYKFPTGEELKTLEILSGLCIVTVLHFKCNVTHGILFWGGWGKLVFVLLSNYGPVVVTLEGQPLLSTSSCLLEVFLPSVPTPRPHASAHLHIFWEMVTTDRRRHEWVRWVPQIE